MGYWACGTCFHFHYSDESITKLKTIIYEAQPKDDSTFDVELNWKGESEERFHINTFNSNLEMIKADYSSWLKSFEFDLQTHYSPDAIALEIIVTGKLEYRLLIPIIHVFDSKEHKTIKKFNS